LETEVCILYADRVPKKGITNPLTNQLYKNPILKIHKKTLGNLLPSNIRIRMLYAGICGTDLQMTNTDDEGYLTCSAPADIPEDGIILGHEGIGIIEEIGSNVTSLKKSMYVVFESILVCGYCQACKRGNFNQCMNSKLLGMQIDGIFGKIIDIPASIAHDVSSLILEHNVSMTELCCIEPTSVAYVGCENLHLNGGDNVVIFGAGPIGLSSALIARNIFGASQITIVEPVEFRQKLALNWCDKVYGIEEFFETKHERFDAVMETSGHMDNINRVFKQLNINARIALLARLGQPLFIEHVDHMITNAISIIGSRGHLGGAFNRIQNLIKYKRISFEPLITNVLTGLESLKHYLTVGADEIIEKNCKVLVKF
jgi:(R,R)-butanediol dehydrogenase / meso-butanediol dehydrogenase / diacetyl reductase